MMETCIGNADLLSFCRGVRGDLGGGTPTDLWSFLPNLRIRNSHSMLPVSDLSDVDPLDQLRVSQKRTSRTIIGSVHSY